jgi:hypothetical protein
MVRAVRLAARAAGMSDPTETTVTCPIDGYDVTLYSDGEVEIGWVLVEHEPHPGEPCSFRVWFDGPAR